MVMRFVAALLASLAIACGPSGGEKGDKGDPGEPGPQGPQGQPGQGGSTQGQQIVEVFGTGQIQVTSATSYSVVPGLTTTVAIPANAKVRVDTSGGIQCTQTGAAYSVVDLALFVDDAISSAGGQRRIVAANTQGLAQTISNWSFSRSYTLPAGNHVFEVRTQGVDPNAAAANVSSASAPQLQGTLTVTVLLL
jgi:hypothetical protein